MKKRIIIISVIVVVAIAAAFFFLNRNKHTAPKWKTARVEKGNVSVNITATGSLNAITTVQVGAQVSGIVAKIFVDFDSVVKKGQVIAALDTVLLYASMKDAAAAVQKANAQVELTRRQYVRMDTLFQEKVAAQADYDLAQANYKAALADQASAEATLEHEKTNLHYATIKAPINGTVISRNVDVGQTVISSFNAPTLFTIANDLTQMQVLADVDEADIGEVKVGQETEFTVDAYPYDVFRGTVAQIRLQPVMIQNVNNYVVVINVPNPDLKLLPGLTATTTIKTQQHNDVLTVPMAATHFTPPADYLQTINIPDSIYRGIQNKRVAVNEIPKPGSECYIWINKEGTLKPVLVTVGLFDGANLEVAGDIKQHDEVVMGVVSGGTASATSPTANNPFMPQMRPQQKSK